MFSRTMRWRHALYVLAAATALLAQGAAAPPASDSATAEITSPRQQFGHDIGDDYFLINYSQALEYLTRLADESKRLRIVEIGRSVEGRPIAMVIVTSPENQQRLERYRDISRRLALAEGLTDEEARQLAAEGRAVVWIDGGLHAAEVLGAQQLVEMVYQLASRTDAETMRLLNDDIVLCTFVNPDGMELVSDWYMRRPEPAKRSLLYVPRLYQHYIGHDDNRDFYISNQPETTAINRVFFQDWFPQIVYNHHQSGPSGTVMFSPPFRDPFNYNFDPLVPMEIDLVGAAMHARFLSEGKTGVTSRSGSTYSTWWNGGLRTIAYFHNMVGLLTETIGNPTPIDIPFVIGRTLPRGDLPAPIEPQRWHFRQSIDYSITANRAVLDVASRFREPFLYNIYLMGRHAIERGQRDSWTIHPKVVDAAERAVTAERGGTGSAAIGTAEDFRRLLRSSTARDPRGYIIRADQADFLTATKFANALIKTGIIVDRSTAPFQVHGTLYPAGSYIVRTAQPFRAHVLDMFEPQDYPNDFECSGGPPTAPYDNAGYTLAIQMGVKYDRVLDGFDGPFERLPMAPVKPNPGTILRNSVGSQQPAGYLLDHEVNDAFVAENRLLKSGADVYWLKAPLTANGRVHPPGTIYIASKPGVLPVLQGLATDIGLTFEEIADRPTVGAMKLNPVRVGLWDQYGGSMPSGQIRWMFEQQYELPFETVYPQTLDSSNLSARFDVLIFVGDAIPPEGTSQPTGGVQPRSEDIPAEFRSSLGRVTAATTIPRLKQFVEHGGTIVAIGSSTSLARYLGVPIRSALEERIPGGGFAPLPPEKFYIPGSILRTAVDNTTPLGYGFGNTVDVVYDNSPAFLVAAGSGAKGVTIVARFDSDAPLVSGWAWGQRYLRGAAAVVDAKVGAGRLLLFGPEITFRAQPHGTFKFLFNAIYYGSAKDVALK